MVFWPARDLPRAAHRLDRLGEGARRDRPRSGCAGSSLPSAMNKVPKSGPDAPPTVITSLVPIAFSASGSGFAASCVGFGSHRLEAALHVEAVVAVADRLVERGQLVGMPAMVSAAAATSLEKSDAAMSPMLMVLLCRQRRENLCLTIEASSSTGQAVASNSARAAKTSATA